VWLSFAPEIQKEVLMEDRLEGGQRTDTDQSPLAGSATVATGTSTAESTASADAPTPVGPDFVYAIGRVEPRFPSLAVEKELAQAIGRGGAAGLTDHQALHRALTDRANRYLARRLCWAFLVENLETYVLVPRDPGDFDLLIDAVRAEPSAGDLDVVLGQRGPIAQPQMCAGLAVPVVVVDQLWSFTRDGLLEAIPRPEGSEDDADRFEQMAGELFDRVMQLADNAGATDEHRALNYLAVRYPAIYTRTAEALAANSSLTGVEVRRSRLAGVRNIVDVVFSYTHRESDVTEQSFVRVDVTEDFPFIVSRLAPFYER
jgi:PatG C-terminal